MSAAAESSLLGEAAIRAAVAAARPLGDDGAPLNAPEIPVGKCPVEALGYDNGVYFFVDVVDQVRRVSERALTSSAVFISLFGERLDWLATAFPSEIAARKDGKLKWNIAAAATFLVAQCHVKGPFDPSADVRGPGVWDDGAGGLIVHCGDDVLRLALNGAESGWVGRGVRIGGYLYAAGRPETRPAEDEADGEEAVRLLELIRTWNWRDRQNGPELAVGWLTLAMVTGAIATRPILRLHGESGSGKSSFFKVCEAVVGTNALRWERGTFAGVRDAITKGNACRPVFLDEVEASEDTRACEALNEMARYAFDRGQGRMVIGGDAGRTVKVEAAFAYGSVEPPPLKPQDVNRSIFLYLEPLSPDVMERGKNLEQETLPQMRLSGPRLRRRLYNRWGLYPKVLKAFRTALLGAGHPSRVADTYGPAAAAQHMLLGEGAPAEQDLAYWVAVIGKRVQNDMPLSHGEACWLHLVGTHVNSWRGGHRLQLGQQIRAARDGNSYALNTIKQHGISIQTDPAVGNGAAIHWVAIAVQHPELEKIFTGTRWKGGGWTDPLRTLDWAGATPHAVRYGAAGALRSTRVPASRLGEKNSDDVFIGSDGNSIGSLDYDK